MVGRFSNRPASPFTKHSNNEVHMFNDLNMIKRKAGVPFPEDFWFRFKITTLTNENTTALVIFDSWKQLSTPQTVHPELPPLAFQPMSMVLNPTSEDELTMRTDAEEMNLIFKFKYYLDHI